MHANQPKGSRALLRADHERIDALLSTLIAAVRADERDAIAAAWANVEEAVLDHFDVEETLVFPALGRTEPAEVEALGREHDEMRCAVDEIDLAVDLHTLRCEPVEALCARLRAHAQREDALAYAVAERELRPSAARSVLERLRRFSTALPRESLTPIGGQP